MKKQIKLLKISMNGQNYIISSSTRVQKLIKFFALNEKEIAIELNNKILKKENLNRLRLKNLDKLEIVTIVGGG